MRRFPVVSILSVLSATLPLKAAGDHYVATNGSDAASGSFEEPFATIQHAVSVAETGDTCFVRGGTYHEEVDFSGVENLTVAAWSNEAVTLDGTVEVSNDWTLHTNGIYKTTLTEDVWQLWVDGEHMTVARFPNTETWSEQMWDRYAARRYEAATGVNGTMVDDPAVGAEETLAGAGVSFNDCVAVLNTRNWTTYARRVENHAAGSDTFSYVPTADYKDTRAAYFMEGGIGDAELVMLDRPNEWAFDETTQVLYLKTADGLSPAGHEVRARNQDYFFVGNGTTKQITIDGFDFFGTTFNFADGEGITVQNCSFRYPSFSKRVLGSLDPPEPTRFTDGVNCTLYNCDFRYVEGPALHYKRAENTVIDNNYFYMVDYGCLDEGYSLNGNATKGVVYRRNTLEITGASEGCRIGTDETYPATVEFNYHTRCGSQQTDGSSVQFAPTAVSNSVGRFNWFIDNERYSFRYDGDPGGHYGNFFRNVSRCPLKTAYRLKGDFHEIYNNTAVYVAGDMNVSVDKGGNASTTTRNNAADKFTWWPIPGTADHNYNGLEEGVLLHDLLRDPDNLDFRPRTNSALIDAGVPVATLEGIDVTAGYLGAAPDLGAYEFGGTHYFIPGRIWPQASRPVPPEGSTTVKADADLMWLHGMNAVAHEVYFGTSSNAVAAAGPASPEFKGRQSSNIYTPPALNRIPYFWRIDTVTPAETIQGEVWSFVPDVPMVGKTATLHLTPTDDAWILENDGENHGFDSFVRVRTDNRKPYLKFVLERLDGAALTDARLMIRSEDSPIIDTTVYRVDDNNWDEAAITGLNNPVPGEAIDTVAGIVPETWYSFDVSEWITDEGTWSVSMATTHNEGGRDWYSKESAHAPYLVVSYQSDTADVNTNNVPDWWETRYFGHIVANTDADSDGADNYGEYVADTDPTNAASVFVLSGAPVDAANFMLSFTASTNRNYIVKSSTNLVSGVWNIETNIAPGGGADLDLGLPAGGAECFYRVDAVLP